MIYVNVILIGFSAFLAGISEHPIARFLNAFASIFNMGVVIAHIAV